MYKLSGLILLNIIFNLGMVWLFWQLRFRRRPSCCEVQGGHSLNPEIVEVAEDLREVCSQVRQLEERLVERDGH